MTARLENASTGRRWPMLAVVVLASVTAACGAVAERATEEIVEQAIENQGTGNVDVEIDQSDGGIQMSDDTGQVNIGGGAEVPADFPIPVPEGGTVIFSMGNTDGSAVTIQYDADRFDELVATYDDFFAGQSDVQRNEVSEPRSVTWLAGVGFVTVADAGADGVVLNASVAP